MGPVSQPGWSFTYGGNRNRSAMDILTTVPTDLERTGDFSQTYVQALAVDATGQQSVVVQPVQLYSNPNDASSRFTQIASMDLRRGRIARIHSKRKSALRRRRPLCEQLFVAAQSARVVR